MAMNLAEPKERSSTPKYIQLISEVKNKIEKGILGYGHRLHPINDRSEELQLSNREKIIVVRMDIFNPI